MTFTYLTGSNGLEWTRRLWWRRAGYLIARTIRAARSLSRRLVWLVPENTSMSPDLASRTCTTTGPAGAFTSPPAGAFPSPRRPGAENAGTYAQPAHAVHRDWA